MASKFLTDLAKKKAQDIDREYGPGMYGGSSWLEGNPVSSSSQGNSSGGARQIEIPQPWLDTIPPVSSPSWSSSMPPSRGGGFGETESQGQGYFSQSRQTPMERANNYVQGTAKGIAGSVGSAIGGLLEAADYAAREFVRNTLTLPDGVLEEKGLDTPEMLEDIRQFNATMDQKNQAVQGLLDLSDQVLSESAEQYEKSKAGVGPLGSFAMDLGRVGVEMLTDAGIAAATGGSGLIPMAARSFGGASSQARQKGADSQEAFLYGASQGAVDTATEKLFNVALPFARLYGGGSLDDAVERGIRSAVSRFASTEGGQRALGGALTAGASALTEGAEEFVADWASWQLPSIIYGGDVASAEETLSDSLYDFLVGAAMGGIGAAVSPNTYRYQLPQEAGSALPEGPSGESGAAPAQPSGSGGLHKAAFQAVEMLSRGEDISGRQATRIARDPDAVALLSQLTGQEISTDGPISQVRANIQAVAAARRGTAPVQTQTQENTQPTYETAPTASQTPGEGRTAAAAAYDIRRMQQAAMAGGFGESGRRALLASYDGIADGTNFYAGFSAYYNAGLSGMDMQRVRSDYAQDLTEAQRYAAYTAGQNDGLASLQREREGVQFATVYGDEAGFIPSEHSRNLSQDTVRFYNALGRATGTKITVTAATGEGGANGWYSNGTVYIAADAENAGSVVAKHEITHRLQEIAPEAYRTYRDYAVNAMAERDGSTAALVERYKARYAQSGVNLTTEQAMDEIAADFTEALTVDPSRFDTLAQEHRSVARRVLDALRDFISKVKALFKGRSDQDRAAMSEYGVSMETLERAAQLWEEALRAGQAQVSTMTEAQQRMEFSDVNTRYSLREKEPPKKTGVAYKVFFAKNGELYPPMVANPGGEGTPVGVWLDADVGQAAPPSKTGRAQVQAGGRGTNAAKGSLAFRPGWHLGDIPLAKQFARKNPATGVKDLFPADFVWAECEYAMDVDYQEEAMSYGYTENGKFRHSYAGLPKLPTDGYYRYRTNPNPDTVPWIITGAMRVRRILTDAETDAICREAGVEPMQRQGGPLDEAGLERLGLEAGDVTGETRFSLKSPVEETRDLVALHNLTEDKLRSALRLGGFPMPSIAVTRADIPHTNFGDITLVMSRQTVDPRANRRNTVYSADAWTPTFPAIEYEADPQAERRISRRIGELSAQVDPFFQDDLRRVQYGLDDYLNRHGGEEGLARWAMDNYGLKAAYLEEQGQHIAAVTTQREADRGYNADRAEQYQAVADVLGTTDPEAIGSMNLKELRDQHGEALERAYPGMTKSALRMSGVLRQVQAYLEGRDSKPTYETVTDSAATRRAVDNALDQAGYERWVRELYSGIEAASGVYNNKERFTPSGNRRSFRQTHYPVTLDNITKAMAGQNNGDSRNVSGFYGIKSLRAGMAERFKSIADMHRLEGRLQNLTQEEADAISNALDSRLSSIMEELAEKSPGGGRRYDYMQMDAIGNILMEIADGGTYTIDSIMRWLNEEYHYHVGNELAAKIRDLLFDVSQMPVNLFEAKPERSVHFNEVLAAVLPDNVGSGLSDDLLAAGVGQVLTYEEGNDTDRLAKVNSVEGARFSLKSTDSRGREPDKSITTPVNGAPYVNTKSYRGYGMDGPMSRAGYAMFTDDPNTAYYDSYGGRQMYAVDHSSLVDVSELIPKAEAAFREAIENEALPYELEYLYGFSENPADTAAQIASEMDPADIVDSAGFWDNEDAVMFLFSETDVFEGVRGVKTSDGAIAFDESIIYPVNGDADVIGIEDAPLTSDPDIRRSIKGGDILRQNAALQEENALLRERVEYWKGQIRRTKRVTTDKKAVSKAARELIRAYNADLETGEISGDLQSLYDYIASGRDGNDELTYTEARRRANAIARKLVDSASVLDDDAYRDFEDLRTYLHNTTLSISNEDKSNIADFADFRKRNFGRMYIRNGPTNIDQVYQDLSLMWPVFFDETRESTPSEQLVHIAEVLDGIYQVTERNPFAGSFDAAVMDASNEIMERFFDLPQTRPTFADRQAARLEEERAEGRRRLNEARQTARTQRENALLAGLMSQGRRDAALLRRAEERMANLRQQNRERVQRAIQRERETRTRQLERLKTRYAARDAAGRERRNARELRARISRHVADLNRRLLRPSDKRHIPEQLRTAVTAMLNAINLESPYTIDPETGKRRKGGDGDPVKRTEAFRALKKQYEKILSEGGDIVLDPSLLGDAAEGVQGNFDKVLAMGNKRIADMNTEELKIIWDTIRAVEHSIQTAGQILSSAKFKATAAWANAISRDSSGRRARKTLSGTGALGSLENPYTFFSRYGDAGHAVFRMLRDAQDRQQLMIAQVREQAGKAADRKTVQSLERETHKFTTQDGADLTLSTAQIMELYELMKREQAKNHLLKGGIVQPEIKSAHIRRGTEVIKLTAEDLTAILKTLTEDQIKIADSLQKVTNGLLAEFGNEASMKAYGYRKFTEENYWPIHSAQEGLYSRSETRQGNVRSIKNIGLAKTTVPNASNPLDISSIFETFSSHAGDMTDYAAWLLPMEDAARLFNFRFRDNDGSYTGRTVKGILNRVGGEGSDRYWMNLMDNIQNGISLPGDDPLTNIVTRGIGSFKGAAVGGNLRVIIQQPTAYGRALIVLSPQDLSRGVAGGVTRGNGWKKALKYSPIAMRKAEGGFDISSPARMKELLFDDRSAARRLNDALYAPAGMADAVTWGKLWNACEWATARTHKELRHGSADFYQAVNALFTEVIDQTQVVDGVLQRPNIMRSRNAIAQQATSFMGEPIMALNIFLRAYDQVRYTQSPGARSRAIKNLGRAAFALTLTNLVNAAAQSLVDGLRDDDQDETYWQRVLSAFTGITGEEESDWDRAVAAVFGNAGSAVNPLGQIPYVRDVLSLIQGYDVSRTDMEIFSDMVRATQTVLQNADGKGPRTQAYAIKEFLSAAGGMFGVPIGNIARDAWSIPRSIAIETGNVGLQYEMDKAIYSVSNDGNRGRYLDTLYRAMSSGDEETYRHIYDDLIANGVPADKIRSGMESRIMAAQGVESAEDLERRYLPPDQEQSYNQIMDRVSNTSIWAKAGAEARDAVEEKLYTLYSGTKSGEKLRAKITEAEQAGISETDYFLYLTACEVANAQNEDQSKRNNTIDQGEAEAAIDMLSGLSRDERAYLWQNTNTGWSEKNNPYR